MSLRGLMGPNTLDSLTYKKITNGFLTKLWIPLVPLEYEPQVPVLSPLRDRRRWYKHTHTHTEKKAKNGIFFLPPIWKTWWLEFTTVIISVWRRGAVLLSTGNIYWFWFFPTFTMCPYYPNGLYESDSESALLKLGIPPVLEKVEHKSFFSSFVCCCQLSQTQYSVLTTTLFMVSEISGLGTGTRLKSLACQTEIHF